MDRALLTTFAALAVVFSIWIAVVLVRYVQYRRVAGGSILSWAPPRPWYYSVCLGIGFFMVFLTGLSAFVLRRPALVVVSQALMAIFYTSVFPLVFRIRRGFYRTGIWAEGGFVPYRSIRWLGWKEAPEIVLAMRAEGRFRGQRYAFLRVPGDHYGQARRILADRIDGESLSLETSVLGLDREAPTQERV